MRKKSNVAKSLAVDALTLFATFGFDQKAFRFRSTDCAFKMMLSEFVMMHAIRLGRPVVFQLRQDVSFNDLVAALLSNLSDALKEDIQPPVSSTFLIHSYPRRHQ